MMEEETRGRSGNRIIALFPDLLGVGGIQVAGRLTAAALSQIAAQYGWMVDFLSLNDAFGAQMFSSNGEEIHSRGSGRRAKTSPSCRRGSPAPCISRGQDAPGNAAHEDRRNLARR